MIHKSSSRRTFVMANLEEFMMVFNQLKTFSLYHDLHTWWILQGPKMTIQGVKITPYLIGHSTYPLRTYLTKIWKSHNSNDVNKKRYDSSMNFTRVIIKNAFGSWKNKWWTLKNFNSSVNRALAIVVASKGGEADPGFLQSGYLRF